MKHGQADPIAVIDTFDILNDDQVRSYFELGCEVKAVGREHLARLKKGRKAKGVQGSKLCNLKTIQHVKKVYYKL